MRRIVLVLISSLFVGSAAMAQVYSDTASSILRVDSSSVNGVYLSFDHLLSIYEWNGRFDYIPPYHLALPMLSGRLDTLRIVAGSRFLQDNSVTSTSLQGYLWADLPSAVQALRPFASVVANSYVTTGLPGTSAARLVTKQIDGFGIAGLHYQDDSTLDLAIGGGLAHEAQQSINAAGGILHGTFNAPAQYIGGSTQLSAAALVDERFFSERSERYSNDQANLVVASGLLTQNISTFDSNHAYLALGLARRDFFFTADSTSATVKQERTELSLSLRDSMTYPIATDAVRGTLDLEFEPRSVTRRSDISSSQLAGSSFAALSSLLVPNEVTGLHLASFIRLDADIARNLSGSARMSYDEKSENVRLLSEDITGIDPALVTKFSETLGEASYSARTTLAGVTLRYAPTSSDVLRFDVSERLLSYDTPSELNTDDHDELISSSILNYDHIFAMNLTGGIALRGTRTHLVYLKADRSAQNDVVQSIAGATYANYSSARLTAAATSEVFATYTTLDYLDSVPLSAGVGNYLLRGLSATDTVSIFTGYRPFNFAGEMTLEQGASLRINERGSYNEPEFSERRDTRITEITGSLLVGLASIQNAAPWRIRAGVRAFFLNRDGRNEASLNSVQTFGVLERQTRIGPVLFVSLERSNRRGPMLLGSMWYAVIRDQSYETGTVTRSPQLESHLAVQWTF